MSALIILGFLFLIALIVVFWAVSEAELIRSIGLAFDLPTPDIHEIQEDPASN